MMSIRIGRTLSSSSHRRTPTISASRPLLQPLPQVPLRIVQLLPQLVVSTLKRVRVS